MARYITDIECTTTTSRYHPTQSQYIFKPSELHQVAKQALKDHPDDVHAVVTSIVRQLDKLHPGHINTNEEWVFNNAGGAMGAMYLLHASLSEYVIIFGTPIGTDGMKHRPLYW
jgi:C-8 sterol isomerase